MINIRICKQCNKKFDIGRKIDNKHMGIFCSLKCYKEYRINTFICEHCGKEIVKGRSKKRRFCSRECCDEYILKRPKNIKICQFCNKEFNFGRSKIDYKHMGMFCSSKCAHDFGRDFLKCKNCKKDIIRAKSYHRQFCSFECYNNYRHKEAIVIKECKQCHNKFEVQKCDVTEREKGGFNVSFCSRDCQLTYDRINHGTGVAQINQSGCEKKLESILNEYYPNEWKYVGDGSVRIGFKYPDFININGKKQIVELFNALHHTNKYIKDLKWHRTEDGTKKIYKHFGFDTLIIWTKDLFSKVGVDRIKSKIDSFVIQGE